MKLSRADKKEIRKQMFKTGCSGALFSMVNRHYQNPNATAQEAISPLSGGMNQQGCQCGMLWGATMAAGAEAFRRYGDSDAATAAAVIAAQYLVDSFTTTAKSANCIDITKCDFTTKTGIRKYMLTGKMFKCFRLAPKWTPLAFQAAEAGMTAAPQSTAAPVKSCASEAAKRLGADAEQAMMAAGLAGGMGLSGNACGVLAAAIWLNTFEWARENPGKPAFMNPKAEETMAAFFKVTDGEINCEKICGRAFADIEEHTEFIETGGCKHLIEKWTT